MTNSHRHLTSFYALTFLLLGAIPLLHGALFSGPMDFTAAATQASNITGLDWTSNILVMLRLCMAEPLLWLVIFGSAVPSLAALLVCARIPTQLHRLLSSFKLHTPWKAALGDCSRIFLILLAGLVAVAALRMLLPAAGYTLRLPVFGPELLLALAGAAFLDQGAVLEELGWRGFAQLQLQDGGTSPLSAAIIVGIGWGLWHLPRDVTTGVIGRLGVFDYAALYLPSFLGGTIGISIIAAYFVNRANGCIIPAIMVHGLSNDSLGISGTAAMEQMLTPYHQATKAIPFALIAIAIVVIAGRDLGRTGKNAG